ncbi:oxidoreductase-like protein [Nemania abortiva]|nr:oxidoreductase-like protein [Nemania abortiva]
MPPNMRPLMRVARLQSALSRTPQIQRAFASKGSGVLPGGTPGESSEQAMPIGPYYEAILTKPQPIPETKPEAPPTSSPKSPRSTTKKAAAAAAAEKKSKETSSPSSSGTTTSTTSTTNLLASTTTTVPPELSAEPATAQDKARIIFGSRLAGPMERADRLQSIRDRSTLVAGVLVPPRPDEPDNCCMSGCVDCVWDRYRDELEAWAAAAARAEEAERAQHVTETTSAVDDTSGLSKEESSRRTEEMAKTDRPKIAKDLWDDDLYTNVPVGIREFMKHEKKLKKKHEEEGTFGA